MARLGDLTREAQGPCSLERRVREAAEDPGTAVPEDMARGRGTPGSDPCDDLRHTEGRRGEGARSIAENLLRPVAWPAASAAVRTTACGKGRLPYLTPHHLKRRGCQGLGRSWGPFVFQCRPPARATLHSTRKRREGPGKRPGRLGQPGPRNSAITEGHPDIGVSSKACATRRCPVRSNPLAGPHLGVLRARTPSPSTWPARTILVTGGRGAAVMSIGRGWTVASL